VKLLSPVFRPTMLPPIGAEHCPQDTTYLRNPCRCLNDVGRGSLGRRLAGQMARLFTVSTPTVHKLWVARTQFVEINRPTMVRDGAKSGYDTRDEVIPDDVVGSCRAAGGVFGFGRITTSSATATSSWLMIQSQRVLKAAISSATFCLKADDPPVEIGNSPT
jgi:hypothetical protein